VQLVGSSLQGDKRRRIHPKSSAIFCNRGPELPSARGILPASGTCEEQLMKYALIIATVATIATPAFAEDVGVRVGPAGVTVGESDRDHYRDHDRDRDRDRDGVTIIKHREPAERTTVIKKNYDDGVETKTVIHHDQD
jgi:hypothetical protein